MKIRDGDWTLFDYDIRTGRQVWHRENGDGTQTFRTDYRVDDTLALNAEHRSIARTDWKGDYHMIASVPLNVFHDQLAEASRQGDERYLSKWLNDGDNAAWRTKSGRV